MSFRTSQHAEPLSQHANLERYTYHEHVEEDQQPLNLRTLSSASAGNASDHSGDVSTTATAATITADPFQPVTQTRQLTVLLSAFLTICITIGFNQSYGVFQSVYISSEDSILAPGESGNGALIAFVGTLGYGLTWAGSVFVNPLMTRTKKMWHITVPGVLLMSTGFGLASLATKTWHLLLTQGLLYGVGASMLYFPILAVCPEYFGARRGAAMGIVLSGAGIGGVILTLVIRALITAIDVRWTLRFLALFNLLVAMPIAITAPPSRFTTRRPTHVDLKLALKPTFILSVIAGLLLSSGNLIPTTFMSEYSLTLGYSASFGAGLIAMNSGINSVSRIVTGFAGDKLGRQNMLILAVVGSAVAVCGLWLQSASTGSQSIWITFIVFYGIWAGGYNALFPTTIAEVFGIHAYASVNGFIYFVRGLGSFFGSPVGGAILGENLRRNYLNVVYFDSALLFGASLCVVGVRYFDAREKGCWKMRA